MNKVGIENVAVSILHNNLSEDEAYEFEIYYIYLYKEEYGYKLANATLGGKGQLGFTYIRSDETRKKLSDNNYWRGKGHLMSGENHPFFGKKHSEEAKKKMSKNSAKYWKGKKLPEETRLKLKENCYWKGKKLPEEMKLKISNSRKGKCTGKDNHNFGKPLPDSTKKKISEALSGERSQFYGVKGKDHPAFGYKHTLEARKRISEANIGRKQSKEFVEKLKQRKGDKNPFFGKHHSEESKRKMSSKLTGSNNGFSRSVKAIFSDNTEIIFETVGDAHRYFKTEHNVGGGPISKCLRRGISWNPKRKVDQHLRGLRIVYVEK